MSRIYGYIALVLVGCGSAAPAASPDSPPASATEPVAEQQEPAPEPERFEAAADSSAQEAALTRELPTECAMTEPCLPPRAFAESLCKGNYPGVALAMFRKDSPWRRKWVNVARLEAVNAFGGSANGGNLVFGEELLLLRRGGALNSGAMKVSGGDDVEVLRWNGTCVTLHEAELVEYVPGLPKQAPIVWNYLSEPMQQALLENKTIAEARKIHRKECRGSSRTDVTPGCERATNSLSGAIVVAIRRGMTLPPPDKRPEWRRSEETGAVAVTGAP
jgi:hypothetical protein